jgi:murein DD-endopeptidase MepM/ murein hydrolase activator NlpD
LSRKTDATRPAHARRRGMIAIASVGAAMATTGGLAFAQETTTTTGQDTTTTTQSTTTAKSGGGTSTSGGGTSTSGGGGSGGDSVRLKAESAAPGKVFFYGKNRARYRYTISGDRPRNMKIQLVNRKNWRVVKVWRKDDLEPGNHKVTWAGNNRHGKAAKKGTYLFRIRTKHGADVDRSRTKGDNRSVKFFPEKFPIRGKHTYGDGFGAARSGHTHQGQDVFAKCGKPLLAARGGRVQYSGYQGSGAGYYLVIDGKSTAHDYVYMHVKRGGRAKQGERVRTGEQIGKVGETGNASGCHLHFELWSKPGWYDGGHPMRSVTKHLRQWDHWS